MKFIIYRTSMKDVDHKLVKREEVVLYRKEMYHKKTVRQEYKNQWLMDGINHNIVGDIFYREVKEAYEHETIELNNLNQLLEFQKEINEELIICTSGYIEIPHSIEIYDDAR